MSSIFRSFIVVVVVSLITTTTFAQTNSKVIPFWDPNVLVSVLVAILLFVFLALLIARKKQ